MLSANAVEFVPLAQRAVPPGVGMSCEAPEFVPVSLQALALESELLSYNSSGVGAGCSVAELGSLAGLKVTNGADSLADSTAEQEWAQWLSVSQSGDVGEEGGRENLEAAAMWVAAAEDDTGVWDINGVDTNVDNQRWACSDDFLSKLVCAQQQTEDVAYAKDFRLPRVTASRSDHREETTESPARTGFDEATLPSDVVGSRVALDVLFPNLSRSKEDRSPLPPAPCDDWSSLPTSSAAPLAAGADLTAGSSSSRRIIRLDEIASCPSACSPVDQGCGTEWGFSNAAASSSSAWEPTTPQDWTDAGGLAESVAAMALGPDLEDEWPTPSSSADASTRTSSIVPPDDEDHTCAITSLDSNFAVGSKSLSARHAEQPRLPPASSSQPRIGLPGFLATVASHPSSSSPVAETLWRPLALSQGPLSMSLPATASQPFSSSAGREWQVFGGVPPPPSEPPPPPPIHLLPMRGVLAA